MDAFIATAPKKSIKIIPLNRDKAVSWLKKATAPIRQRAEQAAFAGKPGQVLPLYDDKGALTTLLVGVNDPVQIFDLSSAAEQVMRSLAEKTIKTSAFKLETTGLKTDELNHACIGWGLSAYRFENYKTGKRRLSSRVWSGRTRRINNRYWPLSNPHR